MEIDHSASEGRPESLLPFKRFYYLLLAFGGGLLALSLFFFVQHQAHKLRNAEFERVAIHLEKLLQERVGQDIGIISALSGLFLASKVVEQKEYSVFTGRFLKSNPEMVALSWWQIEAGGGPVPHITPQHSYGDPAYTRKLSVGLQFNGALQSAIGQAVAGHEVVSSILPAQVAGGAGRVLAVVAPTYAEGHSEPLGVVLGLIRLDELVKQGARHAAEINLHVEVGAAGSQGGEEHASGSVTEDSVLQIYHGRLQWPGLALPLTIRSAKGDMADRLHDLPGWIILVLGLALSTGAVILLRGFDIRNRRLAERNTKLQEQQFLIERAHREWLDAFDTIPSPIFLHDREYRLMRANKAYAEAAGCTVDDIAGCFYWELFPRGDGPRPICSEGLHELRTVHEELVSDGRLYDCFYYAVTDDSGDYRYSVHVMDDITTKRQAEMAAVQERERAQRYLNIANVVILALDREGRISLINNKGCEVLGYEEAELLGKNWFECCITEEDRPRLQEIFRRALEDGVMEEEIENEVLGRRGERLYMLWHNTILFEESGARTGTLSSGMDITERRRLERSLAESNARLQAVFDAAQDGILVADARTRCFLLANRAILRMLGYSLDEIARLGVDNIHPKESLEYVYEQFSRQAAGLQSLAEGLPVQRKDGTVFYADFNASIITLDGREAMLAIIHDITEQKLAKQALLAEKERAQRYLDTASVIMLALDRDARITLVNQRGCEVLGYTEAELLGRDWFECCIARDDLAAVRKIFDDGMEKGEMQEYYENYVLTTGKERRVIAWHNALLRDMAGDVVGVLSSGEDVTERRKLEEALRVSAERLNRAMTATSDGLWDWDIRNNSIYFSPRWKALLGYEDDEIGDDQAEWSSRIHPDDLPAAEETIARHFAGETEHLVAEYRMQHKDGHWVWILSRGQVERDEAGEPVRAVGTHIDISQRHEMEEEMAHLLRDLGERVREQHCLYDISLLTADTERPHQEIFRDIAKRLPAAFLHPEAVTVRLAYRDEEYLSGEGTRTTLSMVHDIRQNHEVVGNIAVLHHESVSEDAATAFLPEEHHLLESIAGRIESMLALSEHRTALERVNRTLRTLSRSNRILVHAESEGQLATDIGHVMIDNSGYAGVWLGEISGESLELITALGPCESFGEEIALRWRETSEFREQIKAVMTGNTAYQSLLDGGEPVFFCGELQRNGNLTSVLLPVVTREQALGVMGVYSLDPHEFAADELDLLQELAGDIAYGITSLRTLKERDRVRQALDLVLFQTIEAIGLTVEKRDPYTAGHQQRVAQLAGAIGRAMGLDEERLTGLHLGAVIHDIGKISVPAEILNRPGKLTNYEFNVIKSHPQVGYEIVKGIDFPWPVAQMIYQHHERLDGSGYPDGLKGDALLIESKILAVADVMEAVTSHRPYRAALGKQYGVEVLQEGRDTLFDAAVVDICIGLFESGAFDWEKDRPV